MSTNEKKNTPKKPATTKPAEAKGEKKPVVEPKAPAPIVPPKEEKVKFKPLFSKTFSKGKFPGDTAKGKRAIIAEFVDQLIAEKTFVLKSTKKKSGVVIVEVFPNVK